VHVPRAGLGTLPYKLRNEARDSCPEAHCPEVQFRAPCPYPVKITFGELRASGVRDVIIYCRDHRCSHQIETNADGWPDHVRLSDIACRIAASDLVAHNYFYPPAWVICLLSRCYHTAANGYSIPCCI
jgi:hypothetical protein